MTPISPAQLKGGRPVIKRKEDVIYRAEIVRKDWPPFIAKVVDSIYSEQDGFSFKVMYDKNGEFYILESEDDIYLHSRV